MSEFVEHRPCPSCGSRDNLAIYTDHEWCWGCKHIRFYNYKPRLFSNVKKNEAKPISLPFDIEPIIPAIADSWLQKYELTVSDLKKHRVVWSERKELLVFPYFGEDNYLWGWQGRYFGKDTEHPKWIGHGHFKRQSKVYHNSNISTDILLVEDIISAIKVNKLYNTSCIFGSYIDINKYINIYNIYKPNKFIIWLDRDMKISSYKYSLAFNKLSIPCSVIITEKDPKEYSTSSIRTIIES